MTAKELAEMLSGRKYGMEITSEEARAAKDAGLVVVYGYSDDNVEFRGAIDEEVGAYEDTGLEPEEIMALIAPPNAPLTLEELREMDGEPVCVVIAGVGRYAVIEHCEKRSTKFTDGMEPPNDRYGIYWLAYRRRPEEGTV